MNCFNKLFSFTISISMAIAPVRVVYSEEGSGEEIVINVPSSTSTPVRYTTHAYNRNDFCTGPEGAEAIMSELQNANKEQFEKISRYKAEIQDLLAADRIINSTKQITERYLASIEKIADGNPELPECYAYAVAAKYDGEALQALSSSLDDSNKPGINEALRFRYSQMLDSFTDDLAKNTQAQASQTLTTIPEQISPARFNEMLSKGSPALNTFLQQNLNREDLTACFSGTGANEACSKLGISPEIRESAVKELKQEMITLSNRVKAARHLSLLNKDDPVSIPLAPSVRNNQIKQEMVNAVSDAITSLDQAKSKLLALSTVDFEKVTTATKDEVNLNGTQILFYTDYGDDYFLSEGMDVNTIEGAKKIQEFQKSNLDSAIRDAAFFDKECNFAGKNLEEISSDKLKSCKELVDKILPKINNLKNSHLDKIAELNQKIKILTDDTKFADVENLKKYVAEKYLCGCNKNNNSISINKDSESLIYNGGSCSTQFMTLSKIDGLNSNSNAIANALYAQEIKVPMDGESCTMPHERLKPFLDTCSPNNSYITARFAGLCKQIKDEHTVKVQNEELIRKQDARWERYNKENYVEYDASSPTGYTAVRKKSNWRIAGEGMLPALPNVLPIWLGNYQTKNNIRSLTDQGLLQKQYLHNIDIYNSSPWLYNFNYFGNSMPFTNGTSLIGGSNGQGSSSGFNFGQ